MNHVYENHNHTRNSQPSYRDSRVFVHNLFKLSSGFLLLQLSNIHVFLQLSYEFETLHIDLNPLA